MAETKKCKHCQTEIDKKAKVCPHCRKKQGGNAKFIILGIVALIIIAGALGGDKDDGAKKVSTSTENPTTASESPEVAAEDVDESKDEQSVFYVGDVAEYKDVQVSVLSYSESEGGEWSAPDSGKIFVYPEIEITNNSGQEINISSVMSFDAYCDGYKLEFSSNAFIASASDGDLAQLDGSVASGKKLKGHLGLEVPEDWSTIEIYYKDNAWLSSNFSFIINK